MAIDYAVLRTRITGTRRDDDPKSPHFDVLTTDTNGRGCRLPVNVKSVVGDAQTSILQIFRVDPLRNHPIVSGFDQIPAGLTKLAPSRRTVSNSLDFQRAPLFVFSNVELIPPFGPGANDDLQDRLELLCRQLQDAGGELFAWGSSVDNGRVLHDIHMNQGNPRGGTPLPGGGRSPDFSGDNGVQQDGGLILAFPNRFVGLFLKFQSQLLPTDDRGMPLPGATSLPATITPIPLPDDQTPPPGGPISPSPVEPDVFIDRALVNPEGEDSGNEIVVLGNTTTHAVNLNGWSILDRMNRAEPLSDLELAPGGSVQVRLSGQTVQLGNQGGTIRLLDPSGRQVHAVSYSRAQAAVQGRFIRFDV